MVDLISYENFNPSFSLVTTADEEIDSLTTICDCDSKLETKIERVGHLYACEILINSHIGLFQATSMGRTPRIALDKCIARAKQRYTGVFTNIAAA